MQGLLPSVDRKGQEAGFQQSHEGPEPAPSNCHTQRWLRPWDSKDYSNGAERAEVAMVAAAVGSGMSQASPKHLDSGLDGDRVPSELLVVHTHRTECPWCLHEFVGNGHNVLLNS